MRSNRGKQTGQSRKGWVQPTHCHIRWEWWETRKQGAGSSARSPLQHIDLCADAQEGPQSCTPLRTLLAPLAPLFLKFLLPKVGGWMRRTASGISALFSPGKLLAWNKFYSDGFGEHFLERVTCLTLCTSCFPLSPHVLRFWGQKSTTQTRLLWMVYAFVMGTVPASSCPLCGRSALTNCLRWAIHLAHPISPPISAHPALPNCCGFLSSLAFACTSLVMSCLGFCVSFCMAQKDPHEAALPPSFNSLLTKSAIKMMQKNCSFSAKQQDGWEQTWGEFGQNVQHPKKILQDLENHVTLFKSFPGTT